MTPKTQCLTCKTVFKNESDPRLRRFYADGSDEEIAGPPPGPAAMEREEWGSRPIELRCDQGHLLAEDASSRASIVMALFGETRSGKDAFKNALVHSLENEHLFYRGFHAEIRESQQEEHQPVEPGEMLAISTPAVTSTEPRVPVFFTLTERGSGQATNFTLFNTSGEDNAPRRRLKAASPFIDETDVFVLLVPPPALPLLPESTRMKGTNAGDDQQTLLATKKVFYNLSKIVSAEVSAKWRKQIVVVVALTKCDRYSTTDGFDSSWLLERPFGDQPLYPLDVAMFNEQQPLNDFVSRYGAGMLLEQAAEINGKVFLVALSGTGSDQGLRAPNQLSAPNRSLDPLLIALMRRGVGRLTLADLDAS